MPANRLIINSSQSKSKSTRLGTRVRRLTRGLQAGRQLNYLTVAKTAWEAKLSKEVPTEIKPPTHRKRSRACVEIAHMLQYRGSMFFVR